MLTIALASAASADDLGPLEHGVALAARSGAKLLSIHANDGPESVGRMLDPAAVLRAWGLDPGSVPHEAVVHNCCDDPVDTLLDALRRRRPDLVIAATHQRSGLSQVFRESRAEAIVDNVQVPTLLVPVGGAPLVGERGALTLRRMLVPTGDRIAAQAAVDRAVWFADLAGATNVEVELLHVGPPQDEPTVSIAPHPSIRWTKRNVTGSLEDAIARAAEGASLVVMATRGHDSLIDALLGSHTERVLRRVHCPVLAVPIPH